MAEKDKYVAYVSSYTSGLGTKYGIRIYDVDLENGRLTEKQKVEITNSSYIGISHNKKTLYSITDAGVEAYHILPDGSLEFLNEASINGMRGCYLNMDQKDNYLLTAGYHDGKVTILKLDEDGSIGEICDERFHKGLGTAAGRNHVPHVQCIKVSKDNKYLLAADLGMDRVNVYALDHATGKIKECDVIHCDQESSPRHMQFSKDGRFLYVCLEQKCGIDVYAYTEENGDPEFNKIQSVSNSEESDTLGVASSALTFSEDYNYLVSSTAGENNVLVYKVDKETGLLTRKICLPVAGEYPKDAALFPDNKHLVSLNHESDTMTFFNVDMDKGTMVMNGPEMPISRPNCIVFHKLEG
ncbi:lactonase family protein [Butyrivibrio sp. YAB3001]|uniref:lactonase family protein n=1 Tax=Butyrivibrio sp. YAB3001 TaxID=1520812 RepID=UPI0008F62337|nr:beta-propeller fold lactonase family protein [Butyrivibrio sp. YAB3001]SFB66529.1 6-phosphogluconolactonase [Butyrivibrio sp. YAB3001]